MDELLSNLDRSRRDGIRAQTIKVRRELGTTGAMVPHHASEALPVGNCVVLMRAGAIVQRGRVAISLTGRRMPRRPGPFQPSSASARPAATPPGRSKAPSLADRPTALTMRPHDLPLAPGVGAVVCTVFDGVLMGNRTDPGCGRRAGHAVEVCLDPAPLSRCRRHRLTTRAFTPRARPILRNR